MDTIIQAVTSAKMSLELSIFLPQQEKKPFDFNGSNTRYESRFPAPIIFQVQNHRWEKTGFRHPQQKPQRQETLGPLDKGHAGGNQAPGEKGCGQSNAARRP